MHYAKTPASNIFFDHRNMAFKNRCRYRIGRIRHNYNICKWLFWFDPFGECRSDSNSCKSVTLCFCNTWIAFPDSPIEEDVTLPILRQHQHTIKSIDPSHIVLIGIICNFIVPYTRVRAWGSIDRTMWNDIAITSLFIRNVIVFCLYTKNNYSW